jgi:hypothetical protein
MSTAEKVRTITEHEAPGVEQANSLAEDGSKVRSSAWLSNRSASDLTEPLLGLTWPRQTREFMPSTAERAHLSNHHRNTLRQLFQHPVSHNIKWHAAMSLLAAVGSTVEQHVGKVAVTVGSETEFFDPPARKDIDTQTIVDLRRMLTGAGYGTNAPDCGTGDREG